MMTDTLKTVLTKKKLRKIFPKERADEFFEALFGDADEGAYDIELAYRESNDDTLILELQLQERPNRCLACNLTQGLPPVFSRHPIINIAGIVHELDELLGDDCSCGNWSLGYTEQYSRSLHAIPLKIALERN